MPHPLKQPLRSLAAPLCNQGTEGLPYRRLAHLVERSLRLREALFSIPRSSILVFVCPQVLYLHGRRRDRGSGGGIPSGRLPGVAQLVERLTLEVIR